MPPAVLAVRGFAHCVRVVEVQRGHWYERYTVQGVLLCADGHAVACVLPSGALGGCDVRAVVVVLGELGLVGVLREGP